MNWGGWDFSGAERPEKSKVYFSMWLKIVGSDFENQIAGTKAGFIAVGRNDKGWNEVFFWLDNGTGAQRPQVRFRLLVKLQGLPQPGGAVVRNLGQNVDRRELMTAGAWHQWEAVLELNTLGRADGRVRMWIDGTRVMDHRDVVFITPSTPLGFNGFKWNPTWGGTGGQRTRDDHILIDHVYLSGVPMGQT